MNTQASDHYKDLWDWWVLGRGADDYIMITKSVTSVITRDQVSFVQFMQYEVKE